MYGAYVGIRVVCFVAYLGIAGVARPISDYERRAMGNKQLRTADEVIENAGIQAPFEPHVLTGASLACARGLNARRGNVLSPQKPW